MALFQRAVLDKYISGIDNEALEAAWEQFIGHFHNLEIQQNIREAKEESYQEGFLEDLFVKVLGYTKSPAPDYNLVAEQKNLTDSKKADGALLDGDKVRGVIELKGTETTDLSKVEPQAFGYKNKQPDALYVIISNFEKLRFYIDNAVDFIEFNLFQLSKEDFKVLWLCLGFPNFAKGLPKKIKDASLTEEENVTKKLYKDYSAFKHDIFESVKKHNPDYDPLLLFKKTQKLLDRFLFIFFAEDRNLLPPNSIRKIIQQWHQLKDLDEYRPLYERFVKYFGYLNEGRNMPDKDEIFAYNGGLFADDEILNDLTISDELLYKHTLQLSTYDFVSEVDVNILGHIFEHSLNEIEEINAELKGEEVDTSKTRRKKDGVFYTPKYITKYIVEHTVGKLCGEKKAELDIADERFIESKRRTKKGIADLQSYREWLLNLTICDPACGSGAFLNQALEFLIAEHKYIDELQAKYHGESLVLSDIENQILENNLFGVDINEESVEIAKLSLWLRTAQKGRKLTSLNDNIKCGNSLIDDPDVAGDKAFDWETEFPTVFRQTEKQAFHVTWVTHNARTSRRMIDYKVKKGEPFWLNEELEVFITKEIAEIVKEDDLNVLAYNICEDHVHILLVCEPDELSNIVRKLKGRSSQRLKEHLGVPKEEKFHLWAQKFDRKPVEGGQALDTVRNYITQNRQKHNLPPNKGLKDVDKGYPDVEADTDATGNTLATNNANVNNTNNTPTTNNKGLQPLVNTGRGSVGERRAFGYFGMCCTVDYAFRPEYTGGFDVVIGNPPYGDYFTPTEKKYILNVYEETFSGTHDIYISFFQRGLEITKSLGRVGFITPYTFIDYSQFSGIRSYLVKNNCIEQLIKAVGVFEEAIVDTAITIVLKDHNQRDHYLAKSLSKEVKEISRDDLDKIKSTHLTSSGFRLQDLKGLDIQSLKKDAAKLGEITKITQGITTGGNKCFLGNKESFMEADIPEEFIKKTLRGGDVNKYNISFSDEYIIYSTKDMPDSAHESIKQLLDEYKEKLSRKRETKQGKLPWYCLHWPRNEESLKEPKILIRQTASTIIAALDTEPYYPIDSIHTINLVDNVDDSEKSLRFILGILNSNLMAYLYNWKLDEKGKVYPQVKKTNIEWLPIKLYTEDEKISSLTINREDMTIELQDLNSKFLAVLEANFSNLETSNNLKNWSNLSFKEFLNELKKKSVDLSPKESAEWLDYFNQQKALADELKSQIAQTDSEIDAMVYKLYGLGEEEVKVVEGGRNLSG